MKSKEISRAMIYGAEILEDFVRTMMDETEVQEIDFEFQRSIRRCFMALAMRRGRGIVRSAALDRLELIIDGWRRTQCPRP